MFPYSCDALLYHLPIVTGVLIAVNVVAFVAGVEQWVIRENGWLLEYGTGLHPVQWLLSPFMHADFGHLIGNMIFLWTFGLITEGKLGWWRFLAIYLGIAVGQSAIEQAVFPLVAPDVEGTLGASAVIMGLLAMACVWAPVNQLSIFVFAGLRAITFEVSVGIFAALYVGIDVVYCIFFGAGAIGSAAHLMGAAMGAVLGVVLLKTGVVECEDYDLLSVLSGTYGSDKRKKREEESISEKRVENVADQALEAKRKFAAYLKIGQPQQALLTLQRARHRNLRFDPDRGELLELIAGLQKEKLWADSAPMMAEFINRFPEGSHTVRIKLAQVCLVELSKPQKAFDLVDAIRSINLPPQLAAARDKVLVVAQRQLSEGEVEIDDAAW
ncbi:rhomboid family intramembrane serine protease [Lacipirellula sp.]|uniref:rhomboid family intramembrane serine protease n=1 Tax=Lacipirellula sp. TaxID=2691419 RepID=UPI003D0EC742